MNQANVQLFYTDNNHRISTEAQKSYQQASLVTANQFSLWVQKGQDSIFTEFTNLYSEVKVELEVLPDTVNDINGSVTVKATIVNKTTNETVAERNFLVSDFKKLDNFGNDLLQSFARVEFINTAFQKNQLGVQQAYKLPTSSFAIFKNNGEIFGSYNNINYQLEILEPTQEDVEKGELQIKVKLNVADKFYEKTFIIGGFATLIDLAAQTIAKVVYKSNFLNSLPSLVEDSEISFQNSEGKEIDFQKEFNLAKPIIVSKTPDDDAGVLEVEYKLVAKDKEVSFTKKTTDLENTYAYLYENSSSIESVEYIGQTTTFSNALKQQGQWIIYKHLPRDYWNNVQPFPIDFGDDEEFYLEKISERQDPSDVNKVIVTAHVKVVHNKKFLYSKAFDIKGFSREN
ncbi:lipoprotein 17-related variable surface protein [Mycoplasmopsis columbinasalis]|uniref:Lipoprotein associated domain n=1 Tax=Mycoplasmopsis columbinasalis TaxID=114880 RepID=A0A449BAF2_9BACT|nr:lipoprotein 17-related variable surface protein [Mycoplasmopsis columbinasalis]VEU78006.1 Lipoprotein associated domain [Mycoplasmopsis columbinasalis]